MLLRWDTLLHKEVKFYQEKAISYISKQYEVLKNREDSNFDLYNLTEKIYSIEIESLNILFYVYELNSDCFSNSEYSTWFDYSKKKINSTLEKSNEEFLEEINQINCQEAKSWIEREYPKVYLSTNKGLDEYIKSLNT